MDFENKKNSESLYITYSQIAVFESGLDNPFNDWTDDCVSQGFSWRKASVSFKTLSDSVEHNISIKKSDEYQIYDNTIRAIAVPFDIYNSNKIEIASISESIECEIQADKYLLVFQTGYDKKKNIWCEFNFVKVDERTPKILKADSEITKIDNFNMNALPA